jgi:hypothetical protein
MEHTTVMGEHGLRLGPGLGDQLYPPQPVGFLFPQVDVPVDAQPPACACAHWPLHGQARIRDASHAFLDLAALLSRAKPPASTTVTRAGGCIDLSAIANLREVDALFELIDTAASRIPQLQQDMASLAQDFQTTGGWLGDTMASSWANVQAMRPAVRYASVLDEGHRVVAKDWLTADIHQLIATLLRRAIRPLDRLDLSLFAIRVDLDGPRHYELLLRSVGGMLGRTSTLVGESEVFVDDVDRRVRQFRDQVVSVVVSTQEAESMLNGRPGF